MTTLTYWCPVCRDVLSASSLDEVYEHARFHARWDNISGLSCDEYYQKLRDLLLLSARKEVDDEVNKILLLQAEIDTLLWKIEQLEMTLDLIEDSKGVDWTELRNRYKRLAVSVNRVLEKLEKIGKEGDGNDV